MEHSRIRLYLKGNREHSFRSTATSEGKTRSILYSDKHKIWNAYMYFLFNEENSFLYAWVTLI